MNETNNTPLIEIQNLVKHFEVKGKGKLHAVDDVSFNILPGETVGLVGESGCGKSTVGNLLMRLTPATSEKCFTEARISCLPKIQKLKNSERRCKSSFRTPILH